MVLNKFQEQIENISTSEILGRNNGCKKCSTNKVDLIKITKLKKTKNTRKIKKTKSSFINKILLILIMVVLIFAFAFALNINTLDYFNMNVINDKINGIKVFILSTVNFYSKLKI